MPDLTPFLGPWLNARSWYVAFSGGLDSSVLLHLLHAYRQRHPAPPLRAVHIQHGLQAAACAWPEHCRQFCEGLGIEFRVIDVQVEAGASLEQAARTARYQAFAQLLGEDDVLFTGQHLDDQAETLLFRLLRGAGLRGLTGMAPARPLGQGRLLRPLLSTSREQLERYGALHGLNWVTDPSNSDTRFARNYLRGEILPLMRRRWPQVSQRLVRSAGHLAEAQELLDERAVEDLQPVLLDAPFAWLGLDSLDLQALKQLSPARQRNALQFWLRTRTRLPDSRHWSGWEDLRDASDDARPRWQLTDGLLQRSQGRVWWLSGAWLTEPTGGVEWPAPHASLALPCNGSVSLLGTPDSSAPLRIAYRQGGEVLDIPGRGRRDLKRLLNELHLPHFVRARLPLLWQGEKLLAVANLPTLGQEGVALRWVAPTSAQGLS